MRIALFTGTFLPLYNGVVSYVIDVATELSKKGHRVLVFAPKTKKGEEVNFSRYPFDVISFSSFPALVYPELRITVPALPKIVRKLKAFHADVVHTNDPMPICTEGIVAAKMLHIPIVITYHTFFLDKDMLQNFRFGETISLLNRPLSALNAHYHDLANLVICPSSEAQRELLRYGLKRQSVVIHNGVNFKLIGTTPKAQAQDVAARYGISHRDHVAAYAGRLSKDKRIDVLLSAWSHVTKTISSAKLLIIGKGPLLDELKEQAQHLGITKQVIFVGAIPHEELLQDGYYKLAQVFVSASTTENQSIAMIEAMAHGLPLIGVRKRGTEELITAANGILVFPNRPRALADAIVTVFSNSTLRAQLSKGARASSARYDISSTVRLLEEAYRSVSNNMR